MWKNINISKNNIDHETARAVLIKMPNKSDYKGYCFWHSSKLVRKGRNKNSVSIGYTNDFTFKLIKYGNGKYNKYDIIKEIEISVEEFEKAFEVMNENIKEKTFKNEYETYKPQHMEVEKVEVEQDLLD
jgi:hypothetical protein